MAARKFLKTYQGRKTKRSTVEVKDDTFERLFGVQSKNVFESSESDKTETPLSTLVGTPKDVRFFRHNPASIGLTELPSKTPSSSTSSVVAVDTRSGASSAEGSYLKVNSNKKSLKKVFKKVKKRSMKHAFRMCTGTRVINSTSFVSAAPSSSPDKLRETPKSRKSYVESRNKNIFKIVASGSISTSTPIVQLELNCPSALKSVCISPIVESRTACDLKDSSDDFVSAFSKIHISSDDLPCSKEYASSSREPMIASSNLVINEVNEEESESVSKRTPSRGLEKPNNLSLKDSLSCSISFFHDDVSKKLSGFRSDEDLVPDYVLGNSANENDNCKPCLEEFSPLENKANDNGNVFDNIGHDDNNAFQNINSTFNGSGGFLGFSSVNKTGFNETPSVFHGFSTVNPVNTSFSSTSSKTDKRLSPDHQDDSQESSFSESKEDEYSPVAYSSFKEELEKYACSPDLFSLSSRKSLDDISTPSPDEGLTSPSPGERTPRSRNRSPNLSPVRRSLKLISESPTERHSKRNSPILVDRTKLTMVSEESECETNCSENDSVGALAEHIFLPAGKKYRRSLSIVRQLEQEIPCPANRGRHFEQSVEQLILLQKTNVKMSIDRRLSVADTEDIPILQRRLSRLTSPSKLPVRVSLNFNDPDAHLNLIKAPSRTSVVSNISRRSITNILSSPRSPAIHFGKEFQVRSTVIEEEDDSFDDTDIDDKEDSCESRVSLSVATYEAPLEIEEENVGDRYDTLILKLCKQEEPGVFEDVLLDSCLEDMKKLGEGVFGEVFMINRGTKNNVLKILPIEGDIMVNGEPQKCYDEIFPELVTSRCLSNLADADCGYSTSGFVELLGAKIVRGRYPDFLVKLWEEFDVTKGSDNDNPSMFDENQLYLVLEMANGGTDLESYCFSTSKPALSIFKQIVCALAVAEECYEFEHRDLHWGNILVSRTAERNVTVTLNGELFKIPTNGVKVTIIDFTLSRVSCDKYPVYSDLNKDPDLFKGVGDYQFDIYRAMKEDVKEDWSNFVPKTNVRWLHYLVDKMINKVKYQRKTAKVHTDSMKILSDIKTWVLDCVTSTEVALRIIDLK